MMRFVPIISFIAVVILLAFMLVLRTPAPRSEMKSLPQLTLLSLDGKVTWRQESLKGKVTLINIFASWCTPCAAEMPELAALKKQFPQLQLQGIAWNDDPKTLQGWLKKYGNPFTAVWLDKKGDSAIALGIKGVPETMIVDGQGMIRYRLPGPINEPLVQKEIAPLLTELLNAQ